jgi:hypothetical protein
MWKWFAFVFVSVLCLTVSGFAQRSPSPAVAKAVYFDVSPPLREMALKASGKTDKSWKEGIIPNFGHTIPIEKPHRPGKFDTVVQRKYGGSAADTIIHNFDGLGNVNNVVPPDTYGDVGPSHYFQLVNNSFAIYDKTGVKLLGPLNTSSIWEGLPHNFNNGDGIVLYDEQANRWLISQFSFPTFPVAPFYQMVAVSQTPDPTGSWYRWEFVFGDLPDYPKFGIWPDGYYMSYTRVKSQTLNAEGIGAVAFDRTAMLIGSPEPQSIQFFLPSAESPDAILPSDCDGAFPPAGTPNYYGYIRNGYFMIREFHADWLNPSASAFGTPLVLPVSPFTTSNPGIPQRESDKLLTPLDDRLMYRLQYRKFSNYQAMVVNHSIDVGSNVGIRWYELRKTNAGWFIYQQSTYAPDTMNRWMGSIAMDSAGNIGLGYSVSDANEYPSIRYTGRMCHDPRGIMTLAETTIFSGTGSQTGIWSGQSRWGDYSSMTVDPNSPSTFWYTQEYYATTSVNGWKTRIASFSLAGVLDIQATAAPPSICAGGSASLDVGVFNAPGACLFSWTSNPTGFTSAEKNPLVSPLIPTTYIVEVTSGSQMKSDSVRISIIPPPTAFAGNDTMICRYIEKLCVSGKATNFNSLLWSTTGDGYFAEPGALTTVYYPGFHDKQSDSLSLKLTAYPVAPCLPVSASMSLVIDTCAGIDDLQGSRVYVSLHPNPSSNKLMVDISGTSSSYMKLVVSNLLNEILFSATVEYKGQPARQQIDVSHFPKGSYLLSVQTESGYVVKPFLVQ